MKCKRCNEKEAEFCISCIDDIASKPAEPKQEVIVSRKCSVGPPCNYITADGACNLSGTCEYQRPLKAALASKPAVKGEDEVLKVLDEYNQYCETELVPKNIQQRLKSRRGKE